MNDLYRELILEAAAHPQNVGELAHPTHEHTETNASCGDVVSVQIEAGVLDENHTTTGSTIISKIAWKGEGCAISQASMSLLSETLAGKTLDEVLHLSAQDVLELLGLEEINPGREKCLLVGLQAVKKALQTNTTAVSSQESK